MKWFIVQPQPDDISTWNMGNVPFDGDSDKDLLCPPVVDPRPPPGCLLDMTWDCREKVNHSAVHCVASFPAPPFCLLIVWPFALRALSPCSQSFLAGFSLVSISRLLACSLACRRISMAKKRGEKEKKQIGQGATELSPRSSTPQSRRRCRRRGEMLASGPPFPRPIKPR
ncbi:hypothetical protein B0T26DRAFT_454452 [Lasiosphaeria miniovina]|uniref:Uncharacterized protein n=1 Tax=Lasiosphaeria miniovina TaxID=1954250 RepID=A0AA40DKE6_9PEZI|nr:uncharacterized protein B0T26DRAFT_454452 [Lasiosphaeria miniovina]KAK0706445.1 hypothetical protein B0T26DRAFT_454452 [Lasiosphaeria miniovina]